jgi:glycosyltransferase involved in cell wall biosynthesis
LIPGPTIKLLILLKIIQKITHSVSIISATRNELNGFFKMISFFVKPDNVIVNSKHSEDFFLNQKYNTQFIPNGVDTQKFHSITKEKKIELRRKYNISEDDFLVLHVGPITKGRNQRVLLDIPGIKILLIASITNPSEKKELKKLYGSKITIWDKYLSNIEEIYQLSDLYVFPITRGLYSIEIPLSVLEAMSCNLPVISTKFGGLEKIISEGDGFYFVNNSTELIEKVSYVRTSKEVPKTREKIKKFSWANVTNEITKLYEETYQMCKP